MRSFFSISELTGPIHRRRCVHNVKNTANVMEIEEEEEIQTGWTLQNEPKVSAVETVRARCVQAQENPAEFFDQFIELVEELQGRSTVFRLLQGKGLLTPAWQARGMVPRLRDFAEATQLSMEDANWKFRVLDHKPARDIVSSILDALCTSIEESIALFDLTKGAPWEIHVMILAFFDVVELRRLRALFSFVGYEERVAQELEHRRTKTLRQFRTSVIVLEYINGILWDLASARKKQESLPRRIDELSAEVEFWIGTPSTRGKELNAQLNALRKELRDLETKENQLIDRLRVVLNGNPALDQTAFVHDAFRGQRFQAPAELPIHNSTTPLLLAMALDLGDVALQLLKNGADINFPAPIIIDDYAFDEIPPLTLSVMVFFFHRRRRAPAEHLYLRLLQGEDALWDAPDIDARTKGRFQKVNTIGAFEQFVEGYTALHLAIVSEVHEPIEQLIQAGADVNLALPNGYTPLSLAAEQEGAFGVRVIIALTKAKADPNNRIADPNGEKPRAHPLMVALRAPTLQDIPEIDLDILEQLIQIPGMDLSIILPASGNIITILTWEMSRSPIDTPYQDELYNIVQRLANRGDVNVDVPGNFPFEKTPLRIAIANQHAALAVLFLDAGANVLALDERGKIPLDIVDDIVEDSQFIAFEFLELQTKLREMTKTARIKTQKGT